MSQESEYFPSPVTVWPQLNQELGSRLSRDIREWTGSGSFLSGRSHCSRLGSYILRTMKNKLAASCAALVVGAATSASGALVLNSSDLDFVVGTGSNLSVLVIDFQDGFAEKSFAWGYRWDGSASGQDLLAAILGADESLVINSTSFPTEVSYFDGVNSHSAVSDFGAGAVSWGYYVAGGFAGDSIPNNSAVDTPTSILGGGTSLPPVYAISPTGASGVSFGDSGRLLADGSWDAWSFGSFNPSTFAHETAPGSAVFAAATVPEPSGVVLVSLAAIGGITRRKR